jgi:hypothetical protein
MKGNSTFRNPLKPGDVLLTRPRRGFYGAAVVLSAFGRTRAFPPMSHIATTNVASVRRFEWREIDTSALQIMRYPPQMRVDAWDYRLLAEIRRAIGMFFLSASTRFEVIGWTDPKRLYPHRLTSEVGDGTGRAFPICGPLDEALGMEAFDAWQEQEKPATAARERRLADRIFEAYEADRLATSRTARLARRGRS